MDRRLLAVSLAVLTAGSPLFGQTRTTELEAVKGEGVVDKTTQTEDVRFKTEFYDRMTVPVFTMRYSPGFRRST